MDDARIIAGHKHISPAIAVSITDSQLANSSMAVQKLGQGEGREGVVSAKCGASTSCLLSRSRSAALAPSLVTFLTSCNV